MYCSRLILRLSCLLVFFLACLSPYYCHGNNEVELLRTQAYTMGEESPDYITIWQEILARDPKNLEAHVMLGWKLITAPNAGLQEYGMELLEASFDEERVSPTINFNFPQAMTIAATIGRYRSQRKEYTKGKYFTELAFELSKNHSPNGDACMQMQLASMFDYFPVSMGQGE